MEKKRYHNMSKEKKQILKKCKKQSKIINEPLFSCIINSLSIEI